MQKNFLPLLALLLWFGTATSQNEGNPHSFAIRKIFNDYYTPQMGRMAPLKELKGGVEMAYYRQLGGIFSLGLPIKMGLTKLPEQLNNQSFLSVDITLLLQPLRTNSSNWQPYFFGGAGATNHKMAINDARIQLPAGAGLDVRLSSRVALSVQSEYRFCINDNTNAFQHAVGFRFSLGSEKSFGQKKKITEKDIKDTDGDGVFDNDDLCPHQPGPRIYRGCPDSDGDGIPDQEDKCPDLAGIGLANGCPDNDGDGISDLIDECPGIVGTANGCPDSDGDGVADKDDNCPDLAGIGPDGCGQIPDGVYPDFFVSKGYEAVLSEKEIETLDVALENISFEIGKSNLNRSALPYLDQILQVMKNNPEYRLEVVGHADNIGTSARNQLLSEERARACYTYLVLKGADPTRIFFKGKGEQQPIANNQSEEGRRFNRRVEFHVY